MSNEIQVSYATGQTLRAALYDADTTSATVGYVWDGTEYVAVGSLVGTSWRITLTEIGSTGEYRGDLPAELVGTPVRVKVMSGATPGIGDAEVAGGVIGAESGGGSAIIIPVTVATSVTDKPEVALDRLARNSSPTVQITFTDQDGEPSDLDGHTIKARIKEILGTTTLFDIACTVGGADDNIVSFPVSQASTATVGTYVWDLWDTTANDTLIQQSVFNVVDAAQAIA